MTSVLRYASTFFVGGAYRAEPLPDTEAEVERFQGIVHLAWRLSRWISRRRRQRAARN
jgi:hypothetical protein